MSDTTKTKKYTLTDEHKAQLKPWADMWIANAMSTKQMSDDEKMDCVRHVKDLYRVSGLKEPKHVLFVKSPFALVHAAGLCAALAEGTEEDIARIPSVVKDFNDGKNFSKVKTDVWYKSPYNIRELAEKYNLGELAIECTRLVHNMWNGGNQWSGWVSYLSFFRHVVQLKEIDYTDWDCYEQLCIKSGPRVVHEDFCLISDRYQTLTINSRNQPHNDTGPFATWSDGSALYSVNNVRVPNWVIDNSEKITVEAIEDEANLEVRRVMLNKFGQERYILESNSEVVHADDFGTLYRKDMGEDEPLMMVKVVNSTPEPDGSFKDYFIRVSPTAYGGLKTARAAVASTWRKADGSMVFEDPNDYVCSIQT